MGFAITLIVSAVLMALTGSRKGDLADQRDRHTALLKAYDVLPHETEGSTPMALHPSFDTAGVPLPDKIAPRTSRHLP